MEQPILTRVGNLLESGRRHIRFFDDWIPDLKAAYDLRVIGMEG